MIKLTTPVTLPPQPPLLSYGMKALSLGSCFSSSLMGYLREGGLDLLVNPYGVLYNPLSIATTLERALAGERYRTDELLETPHGWVTLQHHGSLARASREEALQLANTQQERLQQQCRGLRYLVITWGTAYVYRWRQTGAVVANCHRLPDSLFTRERAGLDELTQRWTALIEALLRECPDLTLLLTISPIRHLRDGAIDNARSKATLQLLCDALQRAFPERIHYFPAYEIVTDELRDYRFYAEDLIHPSALTERIILERLLPWLLDDTTRQGVTEAHRLLREIHHQPLHPEGTAHTERLEQLAEKLQSFAHRYPLARSLQEQ